MELLAAEKIFMLGLGISACTGGPWLSYMDDGAGWTSSNRAISGGCTERQRATPLLSFLADWLHLYTLCTHSAGTLLVQHFLHHYVEVLGVLPNNLHVFVHELANGSASMDLLRRSGAHPILFSSKDHRHHIARLNDEVRLLPIGSWVMTPDLDEHYHFPCEQPPHKYSMAQLVRKGFTQFCGFMEDMLSESGVLEPIAAEPPIEEQYTRRCRVRQIARAFNTFKVVLARVHAGCPGDKAPNGDTMEPHAHSRLVSALGWTHGTVSARQQRSVHAFVSSRSTATAPDCHAMSRLDRPEVTATRLRNLCGHNYSAVIGDRRPGPPWMTSFGFGAFAHYTLTHERIAETKGAIKQQEEEFKRNDTAGWSLTCGHRAPDGRCVDYEKLRGIMMYIQNQSQNGGSVNPHLCRPLAANTTHV